METIHWTTCSRHAPKASLSRVARFERYVSRRWSRRRGATQTRLPQPGRPLIERDRRRLPVTAAHAFERCPAG